MKNFSRSKVESKSNFFFHFGFLGQAKILLSLPYFFANFLSIFLFNVFYKKLLSNF